MSSRLTEFITESSSITRATQRDLVSKTNKKINILYQFIHAILLPKNNLIPDSFPLHAYICFHFLAFNVSRRDSDERKEQIGKTLGFWLQLILCCRFPALQLWCQEVVENKKIRVHSSKSW